MLKTSKGRMILIASVVGVILVAIISGLLWFNNRKFDVSFDENNGAKAKIVQVKYNKVINEKSIKKLFADMKFTFQKVGLVKYDAFNEMGGKLSFSLALLNQTNDGFVLNAVHSREGCYTYIKEIVDGNSIIVLAEEEQEALKMAMESNDSVQKTK